MPDRMPDAETTLMLHGSDFDVTSLDRVRRLLQQHLYSTRLSRDRADDFLLAIGEIAANAIEHGGGFGLIELRCTEDRVVCEISDDGPGLPPGAHGAHEAGPMDERGRGLRLAHLLSDEVVHHPVAAGTRITLTMTL